MKIVTFVLLLLVLVLLVRVRQLRDHREDVTGLAEGQVLLAQAVLDTLDVIEAMDKRIKELESQAKQKRKIENLPLRQVTPRDLLEGL